MNLAQRIDAWLTTPTNYSEGLGLLEASGKRGLLLRTLSLGDDPYNRERLEAELRDYLAKNVLPIGPGCSSNLSMATKRSTATRQVAMDFGASNEVIMYDTSTGKVVVSKNEEEIDLLKDQAQDLMNERSELKAMLRAFMNDETAQDKRHKWAFRILDITDELDDVYSRLDFFDQYGYLPSTTDTAEPVDDTAALMNARSYVSRYKTKLKRKGLTPGQVQSWSALLQKYTDDKNRLEHKLKNS